MGVVFRLFVVVIRWMGRRLLLVVVVVVQMVVWMGMVLSRCRSRTRRSRLVGGHVLEVGELGWELGLCEVVRLFVMVIMMVFMVDNRPLRR